jgi:D-alanine-D-alanine ligase-like ATP-grasp enzyme
MSHSNALPTAAILYADSRFTPWKENIGFSTLVSYYEALQVEFDTTIIHMVEPTPEFGEFLQTFDFVFNLCYGFGHYSQAEVAQFLDLYEINHLSSSGNSQDSAADKLLMEDLCIEQGLRTATTFRTIKSLNDYVGKLIIKPRFGGCHRGISILENDETNFEFISNNVLDTEMLVQPYLVGREFSVAVVPNAEGTGYQTLKPVEIVPYPQRTVFIAGSSFGTTQREMDYEIDESVLAEMTKSALQIHHILDLKYVSRIDFRIWNHMPFILDVNTMPNMHPTQSILPFLLKYSNVELKEFLNRQIKLNKRLNPELTHLQTTEY